MNLNLNRRKFLAMSGWLSFEFLLYGCGGGEPNAPESDTIENSNSSSSNSLLNTVFHCWAQ